METKGLLTRDLLKSAIERYNILLLNNLKKEVPPGWRLKTVEEEALEQVYNWLKDHLK